MEWQWKQTDHICTLPPADISSPLYLLGTLVLQSRCVFRVTLSFHDHHIHCELWCVLIRKYTISSVNCFWTGTVLNTINRHCTIMVCKGVDKTWVTSHVCLACRCLNYTTPVQCQSIMKWTQLHCHSFRWTTLAIQCCAAWIRRERSYLGK